jgi:hypothetical protein
VSRRRKNQSNTAKKTACSETNTPAAVDPQEQMAQLLKEKSSDFWQKWLGWTGAVIGTAFAIYFGYAQKTVTQKQNEMLQTQNELVKAQNRLVEFQNELAEAQRRSSNSPEVSKLIEEISKVVADRKGAETRVSEVAVKFNELESKGKLNDARWSTMIREHHNHDFILLPAPRQLCYDVSTYCNSVSPYRVLANSGELKGPFSPERSELLKVLVGARIDLRGMSRSADFSQCYIHDCNLSGANFEGLKLKGSAFENVDLSIANLKNADLRGCTFTNTMLFCASFDGAFLPEHSRFDNETLRTLNPAGAYIDDVNWAANADIPEDSYIAKANIKFKIRHVVIDEDYLRPANGSTRRAGDAIRLQSCWQIVDPRNDDMVAGMMNQR